MFFWSIYIFEPTMRFWFIQVLALPWPLITYPFFGMIESAPLILTTVLFTTIASAPNSFVPVLIPF